MSNLVMGLNRRIHNSIQLFILHRQAKNRKHLQYRLHGCFPFNTNNLKITRQISFECEHKTSISFRIWKESSKSVGTPVKSYELAHKKNRIKNILLFFFYSLEIIYIGTLEEQTVDKPLVQNTLYVLQTNILFYCFVCINSACVLQYGCIYNS